MITSGLMAIGFMCFTGINLEKKEASEENDSPISTTVKQDDSSKTAE